MRVEFPLSAVFLIFAFSARLWGAVAPEEPVADSALVVYESGVTAEDARACRARLGLTLAQDFPALAAAGGRIIEHLRPGAESPADWLERLGREPGVSAAEPPLERRLCALPVPNDPEFSKQWALRNTGQMVNGVAGAAGADIRFPEAAALRSPDAVETVVGVLDSGVELSHLELRGKLWTNPGEVPHDGLDNDGNGWVDDLHGYNFYDDGANLSDASAFAHGSHVTGVIAAAMNNGHGVAGAAPGCRIMVLRVADANGTAHTPAIVASIEYAVAMKNRGVNVVALNGSFAGGRSSTPEKQAIQAAGNAGIVFCCAAGNETNNNDKTGNYPGNYRLSNMLTVAATDASDGLASYSNYGRTMVDLAAPGSDILSTRTLDWDILPTLLPSLQCGGVTHTGRELVYSAATAGVSGMLVDCGKGSSAADFPAAVSGQLALIERGDGTFDLKVANAMRAGARGVVLFNTSDPAMSFSHSGPDAWLPAVCLSRSAGLALRALAPAAATLTALPSEPDAVYAFQSGTSLATPLVTAAVALAAAHYPAENAAQRVARVSAAVKPLPALTGKTITGGRLDLPRVLDADGNGLPDWWELRHFGASGVDPEADPDGDGQTNFQEFWLGTVPVDPANRFAITAAGLVDNGGRPDWRLSFPTAVGPDYQVEFSDDLATWQPLGTMEAGDGAPRSVTDPDAPAVHPRRFYRVRILFP